MRCSICDRIIFLPDYDHQYQSCIRCVGASRFRALDVEDIRHAIHDKDDSNNRYWFELLLLSSFFLRHSDEVDEKRDVKFYAHYIYPELDGKIYAMTAYLIGQDDGAIARFITSALRNRPVSFWPRERGGGLIVRSCGLNLVEVTMAEVSRAAEEVTAEALPVAGVRLEVVEDVSPEILERRRRDHLTDALHRLPTLLRNSAHKWSR